MPLRKTPLITGEFYHILNRGSDSIPIFRNRYDYQRFIKTFIYYQHQDPPLKFSIFLKKSEAEREKIFSELNQSKKILVEIIVYCLMPNHYHFLLKQALDRGIFNFTRLISNSYSRYFNTKYKRKGSLFEGRFKAVRVENENQLLHLGRYIHLNPYSGFLVKNFKDLKNYPYSSLPEYLNPESGNVCQKEIIYSYFKHPSDYQKSVLDRADYQKKLETIKHQTLEK
jgi:putative transposase